MPEDDEFNPRRYIDDEGTVRYRSGDWEPPPPPRRPSTLTGVHPYQIGKSPYGSADNFVGDRYYLEKADKDYLLNPNALYSQVGFTPDMLKVDELGYSYIPAALQNRQMSLYNQMNPSEDSWYDDAMEAIGLGFAGFVTGGLASGLAGAAGIGAGGVAAEMGAASAASGAFAETSPYWGMVADAGSAGIPSAAAGTISAGAGLSADAIGLAQMGQAAGLSGDALATFVAQGGSAGATAPWSLGSGGTILDANGAAIPYQGAGFDIGSTFGPGYEVGGAAAANAAGGATTFDKFLKGIVDNPFKSALSAAQIMSGIYGMNRAMSPQDAQRMADPFSPYRQTYIDRLNALTANPALAMSQPGYQFQRQQGEQALNRKLSQRGMGTMDPRGFGSMSGGADIARMKYGQEYALGAYNQQVNQLAGLAGATQRPGVGGQAALSAQNQAAIAAQQGWGAIGQGIGTALGMRQPGAPAQQAPAPVYEGVPWNAPVSGYEPARSDTAAGVEARDAYRGWTSFD